MSVNLNLIKELREKFGVGIAECSNAIKEAEGDYDKACEILRKRGLSIAQKKASREAKEGAVSFIYKNEKIAIIELNCETDFVSNNEGFRELINFSLNQIIKTEIEDVNELMNSSFENSTFSEAFNLKAMSMGEKIEISFIKLIKNIKENQFASYIHNSLKDFKDGGKILSLVILKNEVTKEANEFARKICMHIAANSPIALSEEEIDQKTLEYEKNIFKEQSKASGKPENIIEKMVIGRIAKFINEKTLINQSFILNPEISVKQAIENFNKENNTNISIVKFYKFELNGNSK